MPTVLPDIPLVDLRGVGTVGHAETRAAQARALRDACLTWFPAGSAVALPIADRIARAWLVRSASPYIAEIERIAATLGFPGLWFLNGSYQWGCTTLASDEGGAPRIFRTLDWPFPGLGRHVEVARMQGPAGEFLNVTWPGYVGALTAMAPGRFAAVINQAPLRRRTRHPKLRPVDIALNAVRTYTTVRHIPPDQLLRQVFETAPDMRTARRLLETTPVARPVIFTLAGCEPGARCVIERTEEDFSTRDDETCVANDWHHAAAPWEGRVASELLLTCTTQEARANSVRRREALLGWRGQFAQAGFDWVTPPVLNGCTRMAVEMCPAEGLMRLIGYEPDADTLPQPATAVFEWQAESASAGSAGAPAIA